MTKFMVVVAVLWALLFILLHTLRKADSALLKTLGIWLGLAVLAAAVTGAFLAAVVALG